MDHVRLQRAIEKLAGSDLERAIGMIKDGLKGVQPILNTDGDDVYELASMPEPLVRGLYDAFVTPRLKRSAAKRLKINDVVGEHQAKLS